MSVTDSITGVDFFQRKSVDSGGWEWSTGSFVGRPYRIHYDEAFVLMADAWKERAKGIPQGSFLLA
jgi:hypothetical protein